MSKTVTATRAQIQIGSITVDGFMLPDGSYRMSQAQAAEAIEEPPVYALRFLRSKASKAMLGEGYTDYTPDSIEVQSEPGQRGQTRINALPLDVVAAYWLSKAVGDNKKAIAFCWALLNENLERRFDNAFGVIRSESERNERLAQQLRQRDVLLANLGEAYAEPDVLREENERLKEQIRNLGAEPWELPRDSEE